MARKLFDNPLLSGVIFVISAGITFSIFVYSQMNWANLPLVRLEKTPWKLFYEIGIVTSLISVISGTKLYLTLKSLIERRHS